MVVSLVQWLKTLFIAVIFGFIGIVIIVVGMFSFNSIINTVCFIVGLFFLIIAGYFWYNPKGKFR